MSVTLPPQATPPPKKVRGLYTPEQLERRRKSIWTPIQVGSAMIQLCIFLFSFGCVIYTLITGQGWQFTNATIIVKIISLYIVNASGMAWEHDVFGHWFFAPEFFWEDFVTAIMLTIHTIYLVAAIVGAPESALLTVIVIAYTSYLINAFQYIYRGIVNGRRRALEQAQAIAAVHKS